MSASISNAAIQDALARAKQLASSSSDGKRSADGPLDASDAKRPHQDDMHSMGMGGGMGMGGNGAPIASLGGPGAPPSMGGLGGQDVQMEQFEVPDHAVGLVIGKGGEQISQIQTMSGCRVQMAPGNDGPSRPCTLQGSRQAIEKAKELINGVINRSGGRPPPGRGPMGGMGGGPMGMMGGGAGPGQVTQEMQVPGNKCGLVIGKGGETIKMIQERCGVKVMLIQDNLAPGATSKPLRIIGEASKVQEAQRLVEEIVNSKGPGDMPPGLGGGGGGGYGGSPYGGGAGIQRSIGEVIVPRSSVGVIIGKGGETIRRLSQESGAKIQFKQDEEQTAPERTAVIQGTPDQIQRATQMISDLVNKSSDNANVFYMHIPANKCGLVIGRGGETIKQICAESGAHCELSREPPPNPNEKVFVIKGSDQQINHAQHIIRIKVGDIPQGTPLPLNAQGPHGDFPPHFANGGGWGGPGGPHGGPHPGPPHGGHPGHPGGPGPGGPHQGFPQGGGDPQAAYWANYYAQMGQGGGQGAGGAPGQPQQPQAPQAPQPQAPAQPAAAAPAINPATGQPDYSAQWAEYYRNLGMHDQANMIEQQAKAGGAGGAAGGGAPGAQPQAQAYPAYSQASAQAQGFPNNYAPAAPQPQPTAQPGNGYGHPQY